MTTYVWRDGQIYEKSKAPPKQSGAFVISDNMNALRHPITGKLMDSKSQFRAVTRAHCCVEVGNEVQRDKRTIEGFDSNSRKRDIAQAIEQCGG